MKNSIKMLIAVVVGVFVSTAFVHAESAKKEWKEKHPRRAEVNNRLNNQNKRIDQGVKNGSLTKDQAKQLHKEDRHIRREERRMAAKDGGHITKQDQQKLNRQENRVSRQISNEKHPQPAPTQSAPVTQAPQQ